MKRRGTEVACQGEEDKNVNLLEQMLNLTKEDIQKKELQKKEKQLKVQKIIQQDKNIKPF